MKSRIKSDSWLLNTPVAHRGLWNSQFGENSVSAYQNAIDNGYPIEMDIQLSADGVLCCFHDDNLKRITGKDADINDLNYSEIKELKISNTSDHVITFEEFLNLVNGQVPLVIEIKRQRSKKYNIAQMVCDALKDYKGEFVVQSFDPFVMKEVRKANKNFLRGQLGGITQRGDLSWVKYVVVKNFLLNCFSKPDFINCALNAMPIKTKLPTIVWTIRTKEEEKKAKELGVNYIFEGIQIDK